MDFEEAHTKFRNEIRTVAKHQRVPGLDYDDVVSEMLYCLWRAVTSWRDDRDTGFGTYWWTLWLRRKADLVRSFNRVKRPVLIPVEDDDLDSAWWPDAVPLPPTGSGSLEALMWLLLANGESVKNVIEGLGISRRRCYKIIQTWRTEKVFTALSDMSFVQHSDAENTSSGTISGPIT